MLLSTNIWSVAKLNLNTPNAIRNFFSLPFEAPCPRAKGQLFGCKRYCAPQTGVCVKGCWEQSWVEGNTPWDIKGVTPIIADLVLKNQLPLGTALVPGCGSGYDVLALASPSRHVVGLDISHTALESAKQIALKSPNARWVDFICEDFFTYSPSSQFNLIFDYTFFCALEPSLRTKWAEKIATLLAPNGELITLIFPVDDHEGGPPYAVSCDMFKDVLHPWNLSITFFEENPLAITPRKGREFLARWKRNPSKDV